MNTLRRSALAIAIALGGAALALPATASNVGWSVSVGGSGFAVSAGQPGFGPAWRPAYRPVARPFLRPVVLRPIGFRPVVMVRPAWVARADFVTPPPVYFAPQPVYLSPRPVFAPRVVVAPRPTFAANSFPDGRWTN